MFVSGDATNPEITAARRERKERKEDMKLIIKISGVLYVPKPRGSGVLWLNFDHLGFFSADPDLRT